jgi:sulfur relay (sulfurtransferase) DsrC/TusE family protein
MTEKLSTTNPTPKQAKVLEFISDYWREFDQFPPLRTIAEGVGDSAKSTHGIRQAMAALESKGWIEHTVDWYGAKVWRFPR